MSGVRVWRSVWRRWISGLACAAVGVLFAGCAATDATPEQEASVAESIEQILAAPLPAESYSESERCLSTMQYHSMEVLDDRHVLFRGTGDRIWLNTLRNRCIGLRRDSTPVIRLRDSQVCDMDTFQGVDASFGFWNRTSAPCSLGSFSRITREQADAIRAAVREARKR